jgi:prevent-host-death family protein
MLLQYNIHQAKTNLSSILEKVRNGEDVIIAKAGTPIAKLVPIEQKKPRKPGLIKGKLSDSFFEPLPESELEAWET